MLKEKVAILPKGKMEFHLGRDGTCFNFNVEGYGVHPTGYTFVAKSHPIICESSYYWYLKYK